MSAYAQEQVETALRQLPSVFAAAQQAGPLACAEFLHTRANVFFLVASALFQSADSPHFGLAYSASLADNNPDLEEMLPKKDRDSEKTKLFLASLAQDRLSSLNFLLSVGSHSFSPEEIFAAWRSGAIPVGLLVGTHFTLPGLAVSQVEIGAPITAQVRNLTAALPSLRALPVADRGMVYADAGILCYQAAAGYYILADSLAGFIRVLSSLDIISAATAIPESFLPLLAAHYATLAQRCALGNAYPFLFAPDGL